MKNFGLFVLLLLSSLSLYAKVDSLVVKKDINSPIIQKKFNKNNIQKYQQDKAFNYEETIQVKEPSAVDRFLNWMGRKFLNFLKWIFGDRYASGIFATFLRVIPYVIAALVLVLLLNFFIKQKSNSIVSFASNKAVVAITDEEQLIKNTDLLLLINKAISQNNYRLAIRYYYLRVLKTLEEKELIIWEQQKTNEDYSNEINEVTLKSMFANLTHLYDFVWYGNFEVRELEFTKIKTNFEEIMQLIQKKKKVG